MMTNSHSSRRKTIHGYTLVEVMIALTMFAFITLATGFALGVAIRSSRNTQSHNDSNAEVRSVMSVLTADLRNVYASSSNPYSVFTTSGSDAATLLTFSAFAGRIAAPPGAYSGSSATDGSDWYPQSDIGTISYSFDSNSRSLIRQISGYPNTDLNANSSTAGRESILSTKILNIQFQFYDITNQQYRSDWNYSNQITLNINTSASSGSGGQSNNSTGTSGTTGGTSAGTRTTYRAPCGTLAADGPAQRI